MTTRKADNHIFSSSISPPRRKTRSMTRQEKEMEKILQLQQEWDLEHPLRATALGLVMMTGFLYHHESKMLSFVSQACHDVWKTIEDYDEDNAVEVTFKGTVPENWKWQTTVEIDVDDEHHLYDFRIETTEELLRSPRFLKRVFNIINDLRVRALPTKKEREKALKDLPVWGKDILKVDVNVFDRSRCNQGLIAIDFLTPVREAAPYIEDIPGYCNCVPARNWRSQFVRLYPWLELWTGLTSRAWDLYNTEPYNTAPVWYMEGDSDEPCDRLHRDWGGNPFDFFPFERYDNYFRR